MHTRICTLVLLLTTANAFADDEFGVAQRASARRSRGARALIGLLFAVGGQLTTAVAVTSSPRAHHDRNQPNERQAEPSRANVQPAPLPPTAELQAVNLGVFTQTAVGVSGVSAITTGAVLAFPGM
jgi:hypothetical protein